MDNSFVDGLLDNAKKNDLQYNNIVNEENKAQNINNLNESYTGFENLNIQAEREKHDKDLKRYKERVIMGEISDDSVFEIKEEDIRLKNAVEGYLPTLVADNYIIKGKSKVDEITDVRVSSPYRFGIKSVIAKGKGAWRSYKLKKEYLGKTGLSKNNCPEFDNTTYKFRENARLYNEENKNEDISKDKNNESILNEDKKDKKTNYDLLLKNSMSFYFKSALCNEYYMTTHYMDLRRNVEQCILLPELMKRDGRYWNSLSKDMKDLIELQAKTAQCFKDLFVAFGKRHYVDAVTGDFCPEGIDEDDYKIARIRYQELLRNNYNKISDLRKKV